MDSKERLYKMLNHLRVNTEMFTLFRNGELRELKINRDTKSWSFFIAIDEILPLDSYLDFYQVLEDGFISEVVEEVNLKLYAKNKRYQNQIEAYFPYIISQLSFTAEMAKTLSSRQLILEDTKLKVGCYSEVELAKLERYKEQIEDIYFMCGFRGVKVVFEICQKQENLKKMMDEIENEVHQIASSVKDTPMEPQEKQPKQFKRKNVKNMSSDDPNVVIGSLINKKAVPISSLFESMSGACIEGEVVSVDRRELKTGSFLYTVKVTDYEDTIALKFFINPDKNVLEKIKVLKKGIHIRANGSVQYDKFDRTETIKTFDINLIKVEEKFDDAEKKRVELHAHTKFSLCDSVADPGLLVEYAAKNGHSAIAITDHNIAQAFPTAYYASKKHNVKAIYGVEFNMVDDVKTLLFNNSKDIATKDETYVVFDFETTGFNAGAGDTIIEFGAVKLKDGLVIDKFSQLVKANKPLPAKIIEITGITEYDLRDQPTEEEIIPKFKEWIGDATLVAHNATFDYSFLLSAYERFNLGEINNPIIDTLEMSRNLHPEWGKHGLGSLVKRYNITLDNHHRAVFDAEATAHLFLHQLKELEERYHIDNIKDIPNLISKDDIHKTGGIYHVMVLAKNQDGLKKLFELVSLANTKYFHKVPRILRSEINSRREHFVIGSSCADGEIFKEARRVSDEALRKLVDFYDYIEVQPPEVYDWLVQKGEVDNSRVIIDNIKRIINLGHENGKIVCATGDVHHIRRRDKILREIVVATPVVGGGRHYLSHPQIEEVPSQHFRHTKEMLSDFNFLDPSLAEQIVIEGPNQVADMIEDIQIIKDDLFTPKIEGVDENVRNMVYAKAKSIYGEELPQLIIDQLEKELTSIIDNGFAVIYLISHQLVKKSLDDGYLVGSRGSVGSSLVATMMDITEVNPLTPHYVCPVCKYTEFVDPEKYGSGYDLEKKDCPECDNELIREGHNIPFETFLGFKGDKVPDIDLNFSGIYQPQAHEYTKELLGEKNVFRAGTIGTIAEKTAFGYVKGYESDNNLNFRSANIDRLVQGIVGVKRNTGQHPGGIIVIPDHLDVHDFTPYQYPADDITSNWRTTHFDFHAIHDNILKLDILGHDDPSVIRMLQDITGIDPKAIDPGLEEVISLYRNPSALGIEPIDLNAKTTAFNIKGERIEVPYKMFATGTLGMPESGTRIVIAMFEEIQPKSFADLVKISGLSHGTGVWAGNARDLVNGVTQYGKIPFEDVIGCRDDIMVYLIQRGLDPSTAFNITENVRKGKVASGAFDFSESEALMKECGVPSWYIWSCKQIQYMFPKAHATAYVLMAMRIGFFKIHYPLHYYATYFTIRASNYDLDSMIRGYEIIKLKLEDIINKGYDASATEKSIATVLELALEMTARGFTFANVDLDKSQATEFIIEGNSLIPPFAAIDGLGVKVAEQIVQARSEGTFLSKEDLSKRGKVNNTIMTKLDLMGVVTDLPESDQLSLF